MRSITCGCALLLLASNAWADYIGHPRAWLLLQTLEADYHFSDLDLDEVEQALGEAQRIPQLVELEQKAKEKTLDWPSYRAIHVNDRNVERGLQFLDENAALLAQAEEEFGVPPQIVAGILGVETKFGAYATPHRVLDALTTQGFEHPTRVPFFFSELTEFFVLCREMGFHPPAVRGSYAGAMGFAQFMPSNYRKLALDFDGNSIRDLWAFPDAIGSIANYLVRYGGSEKGWRRGQPLMVRATLEAGVPAGVGVNQKKPTHAYAQLRELGIKAQVDLPHDEAVGLLELPSASGTREYWLGLHNFFAVMTYNPRVFYAMSVTQLADALQKSGPASRDP
jgi:membrane-bound lytic murein transglycosylase B